MQTGITADLRTLPDLLAAFRRGDEQAMTAVCIMYHARLDALMRHGIYDGRTGKRVTPAARPADHAEAVQEVLYRAFKPEARKGYRGDQDYWLFLTGIARNVLADIHRRNAREVPLPGRDSSTDTDKLDQLLGAEIAEVPSHGWLEPRAREIAQQYVATLTGDMRAVHDARYVRCLPQRKAADQIHMARGKLRKLEDRMHDQLRALLAQAGIRDSNVRELLERASDG